MLHKRRRARRATKPVTRAAGARRRTALKTARQAERTALRETYRAARQLREAALVKTFAREKREADAAEAASRKLSRENAQRQLAQLRAIEEAARAITRDLPGGPAHAHPGRYKGGPPLPKALRHRASRA